MNDETCERLERSIPRWMSERWVPGLALVLIQEGELYWERAFGVKNMATQEPVTLETVFEAASLSKPLFAYAVLKLMEQGALDLDAPLSHYLAEPFVSDDPRLELITARHVLSHTTGLRHWLKEGQRREILVTPGERFAYSGVGYQYLQQVVECLTTRSLEEFMQARLLKPFGMFHSSYVWMPEYAELAAQGHDGAGLPRAMARPAVGDAAYTLHSTPGELARFVCAILKAPSPDDYHLTPQTLAAMLTPQVQVNNLASWSAHWPNARWQVNPEVAWGLGWGIEHREKADFFWQWGDNDYFHAFAIASRELGNGLVVMCNSYNGKALWEPIVSLVFGGQSRGLEWLKRMYEQV